MNPLIIPSGLGKQIDGLLLDAHPLALNHILANALNQFRQMRKDLQLNASQSNLQPVSNMPKCTKR